MSNFDQMYKNALFKRGYEYAKNELSLGNKTISYLSYFVDFPEYETDFDQGVKEAIRQHKEIV